MRYVDFGRTGLRVSRIGLGCTSLGMTHAASGWHPETPEGRREAIEAIHCAVANGINYLDTAPAYGDGLSESIVGEALAGRRDAVFVATKVPLNLDGEGVRRSVEDSLRRLRTEYIDVIQFHGGTYSPADTRRLLESGPMEMLERLRGAGVVRFIGFTSTESKWPCTEMIASKRFDMCQLQYNLMNQAAAYASLPAACQAEMGITVMRPLTSGALLEVVSTLAPEWHAAKSVYDVALQFLLSDSRIHMVNTGMRWRREVEANVAIVDSFEPTADFATLSRSVGSRYRSEDATP